MKKDKFIYGLKYLSHKINSYNKNVVINLVYHRILKKLPNMIILEQ